MLEPSHRVQYLGVIVDSCDMTVTLTDERVTNLITSCASMIKKENITIRDLAKVTGKTVASFPAIKYGPLHYRQLEKEKKAALTKNKGNFDGHMTLSLSAKSELNTIGEWTM